jgi:hypothetical protein
MGYQIYSKPYGNWLSGVLAEKSADSQDWQQVGANFVRFASLWLVEQCPQIPNGWKNSAKPQVKNQVKVGAQAPAQVEWLGQDCLVRFGDRSVFAGRSFIVRRQLAIQLTLPWRYANCSPF